GPASRRKARTSAGSTTSGTGSLTSARGMGFSFVAASRRRELRLHEVPVEVAGEAGDAGPAEVVLDALARAQPHPPAPLRVVQQAVDGGGHVAGEPLRVPRLAVRRAPR